MVIFKCSVYCILHIEQQNQISLTKIHTSICKGCLNSSNCQITVCPPPQ